MPKFKVRKYTVEEGEIEADNLEDACLLLKYKHYPVMWQAVQAPRYKLVTGNEEKVVFINGRINDQVTSSGEENLLPTQEQQ